MKSFVITLVVCLTASSISAAPTEDATTAASPAATGQSEARATAAGGNMVTAHAHLANSSFTCLDRQPGYYADTDVECRVYHFCMLGDFNGQVVYHRASYMCVDETTFDQQALDCVEASKMTAPCSDAHKYYETSNAPVRKALVEQLKADSEKTGKKGDEGDKKEKEKEEEEKKKKEEEDKKKQEEDGKKKDDEKKDEKDEKKDA